ncbi:MAG: hypothetical protein ACOVOQ_06085 [Flavobacterium sp.]
MKKSSLIIIVFIVVVCIILSVIWFGIKFSPGSYSNVPKYEFNVSEKELINKIEELRILEPNLKLPIELSRELKLIDRRDNHWYFFYIYYPKEKEIIKCWVRDNTKNSTDLAFIGIRYEYGEWNSIERDFDEDEKVIQIKKFEERFVNKLYNLINQK